MIRLGRPSYETLNGVTPKTALPVSQSTLTPAAIAFFTASYCRTSQYSSCPGLISVRQRVISAASRQSLLEQYVTSYPCSSSQYASGKSKHSQPPLPIDWGLS